MGRIEDPIDLTNADDLVTSNSPEFRKTQTIRAVQIGQSFQVTTKEGVMKGKEGDYLAVASDDSPENRHRWPIDQQTFLDTYEEVPDGEG